MQESALPDLRGAITVVGNAELSDADRRFISTSDAVVRFNDMNYAMAGDRTSVHVVRLPSAWAPRVPVDAPVWYVTPRRSMLPTNASYVTLVYERQYESGAGTPVPRLFPSCRDCGWRCLQNRTFAGPSTGAAVISALVDLPDVSTIHVIGMNWNGDPSMHIDFAWRDMVRTCCGSKCVIHPTLNDRYGTEWTASSIVTLGASIALVATMALLRLARHRALQ